LRTSIVLLVTVGLILSFVLNKRQVVVSATPSPISRDVRSKIYFEQNRGQVDERAKFISRGAGSTMYLAATEAVYVLPMPFAGDGEKGRQGDREIGRPDEIEPLGRDVSASPRQAFALRMQFVGANPAAEVSGDGELATRANYFRGNDPSRWLTDVPAFSRVRYEEIYEDIDLEFYGNAENKSQYDFIVQPNADASQIELDFAGADSINIDSETGDLLINTAAGTIKQSSPFSYQQTNGAKYAIASSYELTGTTSVRFRLGEYDRSKPLVIDPALNNLAFSSFLGGGGSDSGRDIAVDGAGNVFVIGTTSSDLFPTTSGVFDTTYNGGSDIFVSKMTPDGANVIFSTYIGGDDTEEVASMAIDASGSIFVVGDSRSVNYPTTAGAYDAVLTGGTLDVVVSKLNATGNQLIYSTFIGDIGYELGLGIAVDSTGNALVTGYTNGNYPTTPGAYSTTYNGGSFDGFVSKLNPSGSALVYSTFLGGSNSDFSRAISIDNFGNAIATGSTQSGPDGNGIGSFPTTVGAFDATYNGGSDAFVTKINPTGNALVFSGFLGGSGYDNGFAIALDTLGNIYATGNTASVDFPVTLGTYDNTYGGSGNFDIFVTKMSPAGNTLSYSTYLGGNGTEDGNDIAVDSFGAAYVTGLGGDTFPITANAFDPVVSGGWDAIVSKLNPAGSGLTYSTFLGGSQGDTGRGIALDAANNVYVTGFTTSSEFPTTANAFQTDYAGGYDAFVSKLGNFAIKGRTVDVTGVAVPNAMIALSGSSSETKLTDAAGNFIFLDALPNRSYTVSASRAGTVFNPSLFNLPVLDDNRNLFFVAGGAPGGGGGGSNISFAADSFSANESGGATTIRVWRDIGTISSTVTVNYATSDGTAVVGSDYIASSGALMFAPGVTERTFSVFVRDDLLTEGIEDLNLTLSNPTGGATLGTSAATLNIDDNGEPQVQTTGYTLGIVSIPGSLKNRHIVGIAASNTDGTVFVATDNNFIEPPTGLTNSCGAQPVQWSFDLFRILPNGNTNLLGNYQIPHRSLVNLELNPVDGLLYTVGTDRRIYSINPAGGPAAVFNADVGFDTVRYGLEADEGGNLIMMQYGSPNSFYRVTAGTGATFLGSYLNDSANFGDRFGIQPDGDYVVYSDAPEGRTPREFEIDTTGHIDGTPFAFNYLTGSNMRTLGSSYILSNGAVNPIAGDVFSSGGNCSAGSSVILATAAGGNASSVSSTFISGIGNNYTDGMENFNARGVTDLDFGARRDGLPGKCLYFTDDFNDVIYSACGFAPTAANVSVSGRVFSPDGFGLRNASVSITDTRGSVRSTLTGSFGYFRFDEIVAGESYVVAVRSKRYVFTTRVINPYEELTGVDFTPE